MNAKRMVYGFICTGLVLFVRQLFVIFIFRKSNGNIFLVDK